MNKKLYAIQDPNAIDGKTIAYSEINMFSNPIMIFTTDGGIAMFAIEYDDENDFGNTRINLLHSSWIENKLFHNSGLQKHLIKKGFCTEEELENYFADLKTKRGHEEQERNRQAEQREREEYERLKAKFKDCGE